MYEIFPFWKKIQKIEYEYLNPYLSCGVPTTREIIEENKSRIRVSIESTESLSQFVMRCNFLHYKKCYDKQRPKPLYL